MIGLQGLNLKDRLQGLYEYVVTQKPYLSLIVVIAVIASFSTFLDQFRLDADADALLLENDDELRYYRTISKQYGIDDFLVITYTPRGELLNEQNLLRLQALRDDLSALNGIKQVLTILDVPACK